MKSGASDPFAEELDEPEGDGAANEAPDVDAAAETKAETKTGTEAVDVDTAGVETRDIEEATDTETEGVQETTNTQTDGVDVASGADTTAASSGGKQAAEKPNSRDATAEQSSDGADELDRSQIPYTLRRDNVKDERPHVHQLFVTDDTDDAAREAERDLEDLLGTDVYRLDAREAIYRIGMEHPEEVADLLEEWGYNF